MVITTRYVLPITTYRMVNGKEIQEIIHTRPGKIDYSRVNHKDPRVAEQLRIMRKHGRIAFDELLPSDVVILDAATGTPEQKAEALKSEMMLRTNVTVSVPIPSDPGTESARRVASTRKVSDVRVDERPSENAGVSGDSEPIDGADQGSREVSRKGKHSSR